MKASRLRARTEAVREVVKGDAVRKCVRSTYVGERQVHVVKESVPTDVVPPFSASQAGSQVARVEQLLE